MTKTRKVAVLGSINMDLSAAVDRIPSHGETVSGLSFTESPGGKGANQALAARRAGANVSMYGAVGRDSHAPRATAGLLNDGIDIAGVREVAGHTGVALVLVDNQGENAIAVVPGANHAVTENDAVAAVSELTHGDILLLQQEVPLNVLRTALDLAKSKGIITLLNIAPFLKGAASLAADASILIANESEFELLTEDDTEPDLSTKVSSRAARLHQTVVVTLGPRGLVAASPTETLTLPALKIEPVDTVGAGDTFCGYLAASLARDLTLPAGLAIASTAASLACTKRGAQPAIPFLDEIEALSSPES